MEDKPIKSRYSPLQMIVNGGAQTVAWYVCVAGAARGQHGWATASLGVLLLLHACLHQRGIWPTTLKMLACGLVFGLIFDTVLIALGVYTAQRWFLPAPLAPLWFLILWANFAMCLHVAFRALQQRPMLAFVIGAVFGPSAYQGAAKLGAIELPGPYLGRLALLSLAWGIAVWALTRLAKRIDTNHEPAAPGSGSTEKQLQTKTKLAKA